VRETGLRGWQWREASVAVGAAAAWMSAGPRSLRVRLAILCECPRYGKRVMVQWNKVNHTFAFFTGCLEKKSSKLQ
jgi:hypothetical protein